MEINTDSLIEVIKKEVGSYEEKINFIDTGTIVQVGDGIIKVYGLRKVMQGELVKLENGTLAMALNLDEDSVGCVLLGSEDGISEGNKVWRTGEVARVPVGGELLGRVVDALGNPIDNKGEIKTKRFRTIESKAPAVLDRTPVHEPLQTGIKAIDAMIPIGKGQRELIIGDRQIGKTAIALDTIINQKNKNVICIYVAIGQKQSTVANVVSILKEAEAMDYCIVLSASASDSAPLQYIAPYAGVAMAEEFMYEGKDVLIIYDDLSKHAVAYRTLSLLLGRPPGREAYPGDVFYIHSRLLERAAKLSEKLGGGSITALPIIETLAGDVSAYIPTNVISITDGQIFLERKLFNSGVKPAVNPGISVSRVGGSAQTKAIKAVSKGLRLDLAQFRELESFAQFGSDLEEETKRKIEKGKRLVEILKQEQFKPRSLAEQVVIIFAGVKGHLNNVEVGEVNNFEYGLLKYLNQNYGGLMEKINVDKILEKNVEEKLAEAIENFKSIYKL